MNEYSGGVIAMLDAQRRVRALVDYDNPAEERPSRIRRAGAAFGQRIASVVAKAREASVRRDLAQHSVSSGD